MRSEKLIVALDVARETDAKTLVRTLRKDVSIFKIGLQLYTKLGPSIIKAVQKTDHKVFLDLKFHDIPHTVAKAVMEATQHGVFMLTVHAMGGKEMMERAVEAATDAAEQLTLNRPKIVAVTVLTSRQDVQEIGINAPIPDTVLHLARLAQSAGCDGVVCSPREISMIRNACGPDFLIVAPGIRLGDEEADDQQRVDTPRAAFEAGANYIVVGRPILKAADPVLAVRRINASILGLDPSKVVAEPRESEEGGEEEAGVPFEENEMLSLEAVESAELPTEESPELTASNDEEALSETSEELEQPSSSAEEENEVT